MDERNLVTHLRSTMKDGQEMTHVIERLRASKAKLDEEDRPNWARMGRNWAMESAEFDELARVAKIDPANFIYQGHLLVALAKAVCGADDRETVCDYAEALTGDAHVKPSLQQMNWYIQGAQEIWNTVKDEI